jgi:hypothetical protein
MENLVSEAIDKLSEIIEIDKYGNIETIYWNPLNQKPPVFSDLLTILEKLCPSINYLQYLRFEESCVSYENYRSLLKGILDDRITLRANVRNVLDYLLKYELCSLEDLKNIK